MLFFVIFVNVFIIIKPPFVCFAYIVLFILIIYGMFHVL